MNPPSMGRHLKWVKYALLAAALGFLVYWVRFTPVLVKGHRVGKGEIVAEVLGTGTLEARVQTVISSKIAGRIERIMADQGERVTKAQVLLRLDDSELKQQVEIARSALSAARVSVERVQADQTRNQIVLDQIRRDHQRNEKLYANRSISSNEMEKSEKALSVAEADLTSAKAAVAEAQKNLVVAQNSLDYQLARLDDTVIKAPFDGLVVRRDREPGDVVVPGSSIFLLISTDELWVRAWVDETEMSKVVPGQKARVIFRSEPERPYSGEVVRLGRETDRETREFLVDVRVESLPRNWSVGQRAETFIRTAEKNDVVVLPSGLILRAKGKTGVYIQHEGKALWRFVEIGLRGGERVEVLEGLAAEETVVTPVDSKRFFEGRKIKVALLGPSGSGKSTLLTAVGLINPPTSGRVRIDGSLVMDGPHARTDLTRFRRNHIGYVFQKSNLIPFLSAVDNVQVSLELNGWTSRRARKRSLELLEYLGMAERAENFPSMLSGGQQQRVAVARALANQPSVILADEPTAALDSQRGRQVMELFSKVAHERAGAVIVVTHDHRALDVFDTIYEMEDGRIRLQSGNLN